MHAKNGDLHGNVPDEARVALLLIDLINDFEYPGGAELFAQTMPAAEPILALKHQARQAGLPVIYVNDNFGKWRSDFRKLVVHCLEDDVRGKPLAELLKPEEEDYFVLKPKHSAFFSTTLELLLQYLKANTLILTGISGDMCVLFTASDAYMRDFHLVIPSDCVASIEHSLPHAREQHVVLFVDVLVEIGLQRAQRLQQRREQRVLLAAHVDLQLTAHGGEQALEIGEPGMPLAVYAHDRAEQVAERGCGVGDVHGTGLSHGFG